MTPIDRLAIWWLRRRRRSVIVGARIEVVGQADVTADYVADSALIGSIAIRDWGKR